MNRLPWGTALLAIVGAGILNSLSVVACQSGYQRQYERTLNQLETQAAHQQARKLIAIAYFELGSSTLQDSRELDWLLEKLGPLILPDPQVTLEVNGYADATGPEGGNVDLSRQRAHAVTAYLIERGVQPAVIATRGWGADYPTESNRSAQGRRHNRRVEVFVP